MLISTHSRSVDHNYSNLFNYIQHTARTSCKT